MAVFGDKAGVNIRDVKSHLNIEMRLHEFDQLYASRKSGFEKSWEQVRIGCSDAIEAFTMTGRLLYRGRRTPGQPIYRSESRADRLPVATSAELTAMIDHWFRDHGFVATRSNSVMATGDVGQAQSYTGRNISNLYVFIPVDGAAITWSRHVNDLYIDIPHNIYQEEGERDSEIVGQWLEKVARYRKDDLIGAIKSHHEIMFSGAYWMFQGQSYEDLIKTKLGLEST